MGRYFRNGLCLLLIVALVLGQIAAVGATVNVTAIEWGPVAVAAAMGGIYTAVKYTVAGCISYCSTVWSGITLAASAAAWMTAVLIYYGSIVGLAGIAAYMLYKGLVYVDGVLNAPGATTYSCKSNCGPTQSVNSYLWGVHLNQSGAYAAASAFSAANVPGTGWTCGAMGVGFAPNLAWQNPPWSGCYRQCTRQNPYPYSYFAQWVYPCCGGDVVQTNQDLSPIGVAALDDMIRQDANGTNGAEAQGLAQGAGVDAVQVLSPGFNDWVDARHWPWLPGTEPLGLPSDVWEGVRDRLNTAAPPAVVDALDDVDTGYVPDVPGVDMTKTDYRDAVRDGVKEAYRDLGIVETLEEIAEDGADDDVIPPPDVSPLSGGNATASAKDSITDRLDTFWGVLEQLPVVQLLTGLSITAGGSPVVTIQMPAFFGVGGGPLVLDFSDDTVIGVDYGEIFSAAGNVMLVVVSVGWLMFLFM